MSSPRRDELPFLRRWLFGISFCAKRPSWYFYFYQSDGERHREPDYYAHACFHDAYAPDSHARYSGLGDVVSNRRDKCRPGLPTFFSRVNNPTSTLIYGATSTFPDAVAFDGTTNTTTDTTAIGANLHFRVASSGTPGGLYSSSLWGPNDSDGIGERGVLGFSDYKQSRRLDEHLRWCLGDHHVQGRANAPGTQRSGNYTGQITITATALP